jgi:hypothetical protein
MANYWHELLTAVPVPRGHKPSGYNFMSLEVLRAITIWCSAALLWDVTPYIFVDTRRYHQHSGNSVGIKAKEYNSNKSTNQMQ